MQTLASDRTGHLVLRNAHAYAHSLIKYLTKWRKVEAAASAGAGAGAGARQPTLDMDNLHATVSPPLTSVYTHLNPEECEAVQFKAAMSVLRTLQSDDPTASADQREYFISTHQDRDRARAITLESLGLCPRESYEDLRRHLGNKGLYPSETRALLLRGAAMDRRFHIERSTAHPSGGLRLLPPVPGQHSHKWSLLWLQCVRKLPFDCVNTIVQYLPAPRVWTWSLHRAKARMRSAPQVVMRDLFIIVDEIFSDSQLFSSYGSGGNLACAVAAHVRSTPLAAGGESICIVGQNQAATAAASAASAASASCTTTSTALRDETADTSLEMQTSALSLNRGDGEGSDYGDTDENDMEVNVAKATHAPTAQSLHKEMSVNFRETHKQRHTLVHIARTSYLQQYLVQYCSMPIALVQSCIYWADLQSNFSDIDNTNSDRELSITAKIPCLQNLLSFVKSLHKWHQHRDCLLSSLEMPAVLEAAVPKAQRKYSPFRPSAVCLLPAPDALHEHPRALINEDVGVCVNFIVESATIKPKTPGGERKLTNSSTWSASNQGSKVSPTGQLDRGIPGVNYANDYDSDDSADSANDYDDLDTDAGDNDGEDGHDDSAGETTTVAATVPGNGSAVGQLVPQDW